MLREELLKSLRRISDEERDILAKHVIDKDLYTGHVDFDVDSSKLMSVGRYMAARTHTRFTDFPEHSHNYIEIMYVCSGSITHVIDGEEIVMAGGDILFMNKYVRHSIKKTGADDIGINFIILPEFFDIPLVMLKADKSNPLADFLLSTLRIEDKKPRYLHFKTAGDCAVENLMENIISSLIKGEDRENINQFTMGLIFLHLFEAINTALPQSDGDAVVSAAIEYINKRYKDANLTELATSMHRSVSNMSKIIKNTSGCTFSRLLQKKRMEQAAVFLADTSMSVAEIINAVGYENSSYFYKSFRSEYGMSPRDFRMRRKEK